MRRSCRHWLALVPCLIVIGLLGACVHGSGIDEKSNELVWKGTWIQLPPTMTHRGANMLVAQYDNVEEAFPAGTNAPVAIYAHGCAGLISEAHLHTEMLRKAGFVVFAPNFYMRPGVPSSCAAGPRSYSGSWSRIAARLAEVEYFVNRAKALRWVDPNRILLFGFSEGGMTVMQYPRADVAGVVVNGNHCSMYGARPPTTPASVPLLVMFTREDEWLTHEGRIPTQRCSAYRSGDNFTEVIVPGKEHDAVSLPEPRAAFDKFAAKVLQR